MVQRRPGSRPLPVPTRRGAPPRRSPHRQPGPDRSCPDKPVSVPRPRHRPRCRACGGPCGTALGHNDRGFPSRPQSHLPPATPIAMQGSPSGLGQSASAAQPRPSAAHTRNALAPAQCPLAQSSSARHGSKEGAPDRPGALWNATRKGPPPVSRARSVQLWPGPQPAPDAQHVEQTPAQQILSVMFRGKAFLITGNQRSTTRARAWPTRRRRRACGARRSPDGIVTREGRRPVLALSVATRTLRVS